MISHSKKFAFLHLPKCAGTSLRSVLEPYRDEEKMGLGHPRLRVIMDDYYLIRPCGQEIYINKDSYKIFTFVRNPFDRLVSAFFYLKSGGGNNMDSKFSKDNNLPDTKFTDFVKDQLRRCKYIHFRKIVGDLILERDLKHVDFIGKIESFNSDWELLCSKIGIPYSKIPNKNSSNHKNYREHYTDETRAIVEDYYSKDIEHFKYEF